MVSTIRTYGHIQMRRNRCHEKCLDAAPIAVALWKPIIFGQKVNLCINKLNFGNKIMIESVTYKIMEVQIWTGSVSRKVNAFCRQATLITNALDNETSRK